MKYSMAGFFVLPPVVSFFLDLLRHENVFFFSHAQDLMDLTTDHFGGVCKIAGCRYNPHEDFDVDPLVHYAFYHHKLAEKAAERNLDPAEFAPIEAGERHLRPFK